MFSSSFFRNSVQTASGIKRIATSTRDSPGHASELLGPFRTEPLFCMPSENVNAALVVSSFSVHLAASRDRPNDLHVSVPNSDVPVMHVAGRVAVAGHEAELVADLQDALGIVDDAVLI
jgi:hypothetical protein